MLVVCTKMADVNKNTEEIFQINREERRKFALKAGIFLTGVTIVSAIAGFGTTVAAVRKRETELLSAAGFSEGKISQILAHEEGTRLALRALGWGTVLAITGVSAICYTGWKLSGAQNFQEFRNTVGKILPRIPKSENPGRSEFENLHDFIEYVSKPSMTKP